jgi:hypothetical protein
MQAFKKARRRFKERVSEQVLGAEKFVDPVFDAGLDRFASWNYHLQKVEAAHLEYVQSMETQRRAAEQLADSLVALHFSAMQMRQEDNTMFASEIDFDKVLKQPVERFARVQTMLSKKLQTQWYREVVIDHLRQQQEVIPQVLHRVHKRNNMVLDFSAYKRKAQNHTDDYTKRIEREKKLKASRMVLDEQTHSLMSTFTELEKKRPMDIYEDICSILAMQLDYHRRSVELLENELPNFDGMSFPMCQLSVLASAQNNNSGKTNVIRLRKPIVGNSTKGSRGIGNDQVVRNPLQHQKLDEKMRFSEMQSLTAPSTSVLLSAGNSTTRQQQYNVTGERLSGFLSDGLQEPPSIPTRKKSDGAPPLPSRSKIAQGSKETPKTKPRSSSASKPLQRAPSWNKTKGKEQTKEKERPTTDPTETVVCIANFDAASNTELSMKKGELFIVKRKENNGWWLVKRESDTTVGWVPSTFF